MIAVWYDPDCDQIWITDEEQSYARRSLVAFIDSVTGKVGIRLKAGATADIVMTSYANLTDRAGFGFLSAAEAKTYLDGEFAKARPLGETFAVAAVAGADLIRGQPVAVSRISGELLPARADAYVQAFVAGLASADTPRGLTDRPAHGAFTMADWSAVTGTQTLSVGQSYFLGADGGLTASPRFDTLCVARVGLAAATDTLVVEPSPPTLL